jgi:Coenzyme PQQ synthesis protein D (PqqD)
MTLSVHDRVSKNEHIAQRMFDDQMLVITAKDSMLHKLDDVGTFIWGSIYNNLSIKEICDLLQESFDGFDSQKNLADVCSFIETLEKKKLVVVQHHT